MDIPESITPAPTLEETTEKIILIESKKYNLIGNDKNNYELKMEAYNPEKLIFKIRQKNEITITYYEKIFNYNEIAKILLLEKNYYNDIQKIFKFCDNALNNGKIIIYPEIGNYKRIKFLLKKRMDFEDVDCVFYLNEKLIKKDDLIQIIIDEVNSFKLQKNNVNIENNNKANQINNSVINELNEKINKLVEKNELYEAQLYSIAEENSFLRNKITEMENLIKSLETKISDNDINKAKITKINESNMNSPEKLEYNEIITSYHSNSGWLRQFIVYKNMIDNNDYLVYNNKSNYNLDIYRIIDKKLIYHLKGHKAKVSVIKYYMKHDNKKEYLFSCDENKVVICWSLQDYTQQFIINTKMNGYIWDATVLFNIKGNDYCIIPSNSDKEFTRVYDFNNNNNLIKEIYGTFNNKTNYIIPWFYNNNYYLIECCSLKISINNIFKNENYATLEKNPEGLHCCGYIYKDKFLFVTDYNNNFIRIWNLINKSIEKEINFDGYFCYGITSWNDGYSIITCSDGLIIINNNEGTTLKKIANKKTINLCGIQKIKSEKYGECVICSNQNGSILLFNEK